MNVLSALLALLMAATGQSPDCEDPSSGLEALACDHAEEDEAREPSDKQTRARQADISNGF